jgi:hypothetical protein
LYQPGTILKLKEPRDAEAATDPYTGQPRMKRRRDPKTGENVDTKDVLMVDFPYNEVEVVGHSPVATDRGQWKGSDAQGVIIQPRSNFGGNLDEPFGKLRQLYDVVSIPEREVPAEITIKPINTASAEAGPTPEEVFAVEAPGTPPDPGARRGRTPFDDVKPEPGTHGTSPL